MTVPVDAARLDDAGVLAADDPGEMLRAVATSAAQVRAGQTAAADAGIDRLAAATRPRAVVVTGIGSSALTGDVLAALAGPTCPIPVLVSRGFTLPGWVGAADLVVAVSRSGVTPETLAATEEAVRRGAEVVGIGATGSPLADLVVRARGLVVPLRPGHSSRANFWAATTALVAVGGGFGLVEAHPEILEATAERLHGLALRCQPSSELFLNPAKDLALGLSGALPVAWGASAVAGVAAARFAAQWARNAKAPALAGVLPEAAHSQLALLDGPWATSVEDRFADPPPDGESPPRLHFVLLRDVDEHPRVATGADAIRLLADQRGARLTELRAEGASRYERLASLIGLLDYASVYLALLSGLDPSAGTAPDVLAAALRPGLAGAP